MSGAGEVAAVVAARRAEKLIIIGSRKSELAMWQAKHVKAVLEAKFGALGYRYEIRTEATSGDHILDAHLSQLAAANPGVFTKELEVGLLNGAFDIVVHSLKDMPTSLPAGLTLAAIGEREDPRDVLILNATHAAEAAAAAAATGAAAAATTPSTGAAAAAGDDGAAAPLPPSVPVDAIAIGKGWTIGTSSLRREALLRRHFNPTGGDDVRVATIRGNLNTRFKKLDGGAEAVAAAAASTGAAADASPASASASAAAAAPAASESFDAIILAAAGVKRLGWWQRVTAALDPLDWPYGVGQGALGIEVRSDDELSKAIAAGVAHIPSTVACTAERAFLNKLQGGCQVPIGVCTEVTQHATARSYTATISTSSTADAAATAGAAPVPVTISISGTILAMDGSREVTVKSVAALELGAPTAGGAGDDAVKAVEAAAGCTVAAWAAARDAGAGVGVELAARALAGGAGEILGPLTAARPITYGAAELPLDRA